MQRSIVSKEAHARRSSLGSNSSRASFAAQSFLCGKFSTARLEVSPNLRHAGVFTTSTMVNLGIVFQEPLTCPGIKLDEKMSICSSTPQDHRAYTTIPIKVRLGSITSFFCVCGEFDCGRLPNFIEPYRSIKFDLI